MLPALCCERDRYLDVKVKVTLRPTVSQSVSQSVSPSVRLGVEPHMELIT
jgi:hypothetical protein